MKIDESARGNTSNEMGCVFIIVGPLKKEVCLTKDADPKSLGLAIGLELLDYIEFFMEISGRSTICQFPNSKSVGHGCTQFGQS